MSKHVKNLNGKPTDLHRLRLYAVYVVTAMILLVIFGYSAHFTTSSYFIFPQKIAGVLLYSTLVSLVCILAIAVASSHCKGVGDSQHLGNRRYWLALVVAGCIVPVFIAFVVLDRFMISDDEFNYVFIADTLAQWRLYWPAAPVEGVFSSFWLIEQDGKLVSMFPPGWPALLAIGGKLGCPYWLLNPLLGPISILLVYLLGKKTVSSQAGLAAAGGYATSLFYLFNSGSYFAHIACVTFLLALPSVWYKPRRGGSGSG